MDGIELEIVWSNLISIVSEQAKALQRIAFSPVVREAGDLANALFDRRGRSAEAIFGPIDAMKLRSSMTLFEAVAAEPAPFAAVLDAFFAGVRDRATLELLGG